MPLWPGPDRIFVPVSRIYIEPEARQFERERAAGRSEREIQREGSQTAAHRAIQAEMRVERERRRREEEEVATAAVTAEQDAASMERDPWGYWQRVLTELNDERLEVEQDLAEAVAAARAAGMSWAVIGAGTGMSRQAALKHFRSDRNQRSGFRSQSGV